MIERGVGWDVREDGEFRHLFVERGGWSEALAAVAREHSVDSVATSLRTGDDGSRLAELPLRRLSVVAERAEQLAFVEQLPGLVEVHLGVRTRGRAQLEFASLDRLRSVTIDGHPDLEPLAAKPHLKALRIDGSRWSNLLSLSELVELERLQLGSSTTLRTLAGIERLANLRELGVYHLRTLDDLSALKALQSVQRLDFESCRAVEALDAVAGLASLRRLSFDNGGDVASLRPLASLRGLVSFYAVESTNVVDGDLAPLLELPELTSFGMRSRRHYRPSVADVQAHVEAR